MAGERLSGNRLMSERKSTKLGRRFLLALLTLYALAMILPRAGEACLLVAGDGPVGEFGALARQAGVGDRVRFLGRVIDMPALFGAADVFVHPTAHDACSLATLEAMASGLPVITTQRNGAADGMTEGREGFVLEVPDAAALADRLLALRDPERRAAMGAAARLLAERHDFAATVDQLVEVYAGLPRKAGLPRRADLPRKSNGLSV